MNRYKIVIENIYCNAAIFEIRDGDIYFKDVNKALLQTEKIRSKNDLIGKKLIDLFPGVIQFGLYDIILEVASSKKTKDHTVKYYEDERICGWRENRVSFLEDNLILSAYKDLTEEKKLEESYKRILNSFDVAQQISLVGSFDYDIKTSCFQWSDYLLKLFGFDPSYKDEMSLALLLSKIHPKDRQNIEDAFEAKKDFHTQCLFISQKSPAKQFHFFCKVLTDENHSPSQIICAFQDITEHANALQKLETYNDLLSRQFELEVKHKIDAEKKERQLQEQMNIIDKYVMTSRNDLDGNITHISQAVCDITGYTKNELIGKNHRIFKHPDTDPKIYIDFWDTITKNITWKGEFKNIKKDGSTFWIHSTVTPLFNEQNIKIGYSCVSENITDKKLKEFQAITDELTQLYNRRFFNEIFGKKLKNALRHNSPLCFAMMDIDFFKRYNDTYGHQKGDSVLIEVSKVIKQIFAREDDYTFRLGGEEFGILLSNRNTTQALKQIENLKSAINELQIPHQKSSASPFVSVSIGVYRYDGKYALSETDMYRYADELLYEAKESGRNRVVSN